MNDDLLELFEAIKTLSRVVQGQQEMIESISRCQSHLLAALGTLSGESSPETPRPIDSQRIAQAKREIEKLKQLYPEADKEGPSRT